MKWFAALAAFMIVLGVVLVLAPPPEAGAAKRAVPLKTGTGPSEDVSRSSEVDGIVLSAVLSPIEAGGRLKLDFSMDTHSGSLSGFSPSRDLRVRLNGKPTPASIQYTPKTESAHHRSGRLVIAAPDGSGFSPAGSIRRISLEFSNLGEAAGSTVLEWEFKEGGK